MSRERNRLVVEHAFVAVPGGLLDDARVTVGPDGRITAVEEAPATPAPEADETVDARGDLLMPGAIDMHVHFREPGMTHKGDIATESAELLAGGTTSWADMPNTAPPTVTLEAWADKMARAEARASGNWGFWLGATADNLDQLLRADYTRVAGVKLFLGSTTGAMAFDGGDDRLERLFAALAERDVLVAVHAEDAAIIADNTRRALAAAGPGADDLPYEAHTALRSREACMKAARRAVEAARRTGVRLHLLHLSTADELTLLDPVNHPRITAETCPQYLLIDSRDWPALGPRMKCNPSIKEPADRAALIDACASGLIATLGSDHAPHLPEEKEAGEALKCPSGMPGGRHLGATALDLFGPVTAARLTAGNPARLLGLTDRGAIAPGLVADLALYEQGTFEARDDESLSRCGWTPYDGFPFGHRCRRVWLAGLTAPHGSPLTKNAR